CSVFFFFFSSRRRHTRFSRDWSSDVCSSDLFEIYLALYQGLSGADEAANVYKQFSRDFFDLIVIDECHRGSAKDDSSWREILNRSEERRVGKECRSRWSREQ